MRNFANIFFCILELFHDISNFRKNYFCVRKKNDAEFRAKKNMRQFRIKLFCKKNINKVPDYKPRIWEIIRILASEDIENVEVIF